MRWGAASPSCSYVQHPGTDLARGWEFCKSQGVSSLCLVHPKSISAPLGGHRIILKMVAAAASVSDTASCSESGPLGGAPTGLYHQAAVEEVTMEPRGTSRATSLWAAQSPPHHVQRGRAMSAWVPVWALSAAPSHCPGTYSLLHVSLFDRRAHSAVDGLLLNTGQPPRPPPVGSVCTALLRTEGLGPLSHS